MKTNHRRKVTARQDYPYDVRPWEVTGFRFFRAKERIALERLRAGDDPETLDFPAKTRHNDNVWNYD